VGTDDGYQRGLDTKHSSYFWLPQNLSNQMNRQARTSDTVLKVVGNENYGGSGRFQMLGF
jgi:hypothetical protein